jgi:hypothetical protein
MFNFASDLSTVVRNALTFAHEFGRRFSAGWHREEPRGLVGRTFSTPPFPPYSDELWGVIRSEPDSQGLVWVESADGRVFRVPLSRGCLHPWNASAPVTEGAVEDIDTCCDRLDEARETYAESTRARLYRALGSAPGWSVEVALVDRGGVTFMLSHESGFVLRSERTGLSPHAQWTVSHAYGSETQPSLPLALRALAEGSSPQARTAIETLAKTLEAL